MISMDTRTKLSDRDVAHPQGRIRAWTGEREGGREKVKGNRMRD